MRSLSGLALLLASVACAHTEPDLEARAAPPVATPAVRRAPTTADLVGPWVSVQLRGRLESVGAAIVYVFAESGRYAGAAVTRADCVPLEGTWSVEAREQNVLLRIDDSIAFRASIVDERLELTSDDSYLLLRRLP